MTNKQRRKHSLNLSDVSESFHMEENEGKFEKNHNTSFMS
jgi:hypothetical protein